jgi:hypothetical protein
MSTLPNAAAHEEELRPFSEMPGPSKLETARTIAKLIFNPAAIKNAHWDMFKSFKEYGPIFRFTTPAFKMVWLKDLESIERLFRQESQDAKYPAPVLGPTWKEWRDLNNEAQGVVTT